MLVLAVVAKRYIAGTTNLLSHAGGNFEAMGKNSPSVTRGDRVLGGAITVLAMGMKICAGIYGSTRLSVLGSLIGAPCAGMSIGAFISEQLVNNARVPRGVLPCWGLH